MLEPDYYFIFTLPESGLIKQIIFVRSSIELVSKQVSIIPLLNPFLEEFQSVQKQDDPLPHPSLHLELFNPRLPCTVTVVITDSVFRLQQDSRNYGTRRTSIFFQPQTCGKDSDTPNRPPVRALGAL